MRLDLFNRLYAVSAKGKNKENVGNGRLLKKIPISVCIDLSTLSFLFSHIKTMHQKHVREIGVRSPIAKDLSRKNR